MEERLISHIIDFSVNFLFKRNSWRLKSAISTSRSTRFRKNAPLRELSLNNTIAPVKFVKVQVFGLGDAIYSLATAAANIQN